MKHLFTRLFSWLFIFSLTGNAYAQTILLNLANGGSVCGGSEFRLPFITSGSFGTGNVFKVQISENFGAYSDLPGTFTASPAVVRLPVSTRPWAEYRLRVVASAPQVSSNDSPVLRLVNPPKAELLGNNRGREYANPGVEAQLRIDLSGGAPYTVTLQDSTRFTQDYAYGATSTVHHLVVPYQTTVYSLARVENACGTGTVSGTTTVLVNKVPFVITQLSTRQICAGNTLGISFSTAAPLPADASFRLELNSTENNGGVSLPVSGNSSPVQVTLPTTLPAGGYRLTLRSDNAEVGATFQSSNSWNNGISVQRPASAKLGGSPQIRFGETAYLSLETSGSGPVEVLFSDGTAHTSFSTPSYSTFNTIGVRPSASQFYTIQSVSNVCGPGTSESAAYVTVLPGIRIDSLSVYNVCLGTPFTVHFSSSPGTASPNSLKLRLGYWTNASGNLENPLIIEAESISNGQAVFRLPSVMNSGDYSLQLEDGQGLSPVFTRRLTPIKRPELRLSNYPETRDGPQSVSLNYSIEGGGQQVEFTLSNGQKFIRPDAWSSTFSVFVSQTTSFSVTAVRNECGEGTASGIATITIRPTDQQRLILGSPAETQCVGGKVSLVFAATGNYAADNQFQVEITDRFGSFVGTVLATTRADGSVEVSLPREKGYYRLRVNATNPVVRSNEVGVSVYNDIPKVTLSASTSGSGWDATGERIEVMAGESVTLTVTIGGSGPFRYELSDGTKGQVSSLFTVSLRPTRSMSYSLVSMSNQCGVTTTANTVQIEVVPFQLQTGTPPVQACAGEQIRVPYRVRGNMPADARLFVQVSTDGRVYTDLPTSGFSSPLTATLPDDLPSGGYRVRVVAQHPGGIAVGRPFPFDEFNTERMTVHRVPRVTLAASDGKDNVLIKANTSIELTLTFNDVGPFSGTLNGRINWSVGSNERTRNLLVTPTDDITYRVQSVVGQCGYGTGSGSVQVRLRPSLVSVQVADGYRVCRKNKMTVSYQTAGDYGPDNVFRFLLSVPQRNGSTQEVVLGENSAKSGIMSFDVPNNLPLGWNLLTLQASNEPETTIKTSFLLQDVPAAELSGSSTAYPGQSVSMIIRQSGGGLTDYTLSDGSKGQLSGTSEELLTVQPTVTTTYRLVSLRNGCGTAEGKGEATVTILPGDGRRITTTVANARYRWPRFFMCAGSPVQVEFSTQGTFGEGNRFRVQISDSTGTNFRDTGAEGATSPLSFTLANTVPPGKHYRLRVVASSPTLEGAATTIPYWVEPIVSGTLSMLNPGRIVRGDTVRLSIALTGTPPWSLEITDLSGPFRLFNVHESPFVLRLNPEATNAYRLSNVSNNLCGTGTVQGQAVVTVLDCLEMTTVKAGAWDDPTIWACGRVPAVTDAVIIRHTVNVPNDLQTTIKTLRIELGATMSLGANARVEVLQ